MDVETGLLTVLQICCGHDPGRVINRLGAEGQVEGGAVQGMSFAMMKAWRRWRGICGGRIFTTT